MCTDGAIKDFEGNCVKIDEPWYNKELFKIGSVAVTTGDLTIGSIVLIVIAAIVFLVMSIIAWRKRKAIAEGARRASDYVRRASQNLRRSISGQRPADGAADKANPVNSVNKDMMEMQDKAEAENIEKKMNDTPDKIDQNAPV